jgi:hypothetical protein
MHQSQLVWMVVQLVKMKMLLFVFKKRGSQVSTSESISGKAQVSTSESISGKLLPGNPLPCKHQM